MQDVSAVPGGKTKVLRLAPDVWTKIKQRVLVLWVLGRELKPGDLFEVIRQEKRMEKMMSGGKWATRRSPAQVESTDSRLLEGAAPERGISTAGYR